MKSIQLRSKLLVTKAIIFIILTSTGLHAQIKHNLFSDLLQQHVNEVGFVDYKQLKQNEKQLDQYLHQLSTNTPTSAWSRDEKMAYLINTYNAYTLKLILNNYPVESIKDIGGIFESPFKMNFIPFDGKQISLDDVEKGMLLKMKEPRVHFAINCASESCPKLLNQAYEASNLDKQLEEATRIFILSKENEINQNELNLSKIFKWYSSDFENEGGSVQEFINRYVAIEIAKNARISYRDYSWKLNGK